jgi:hypothetical protein
MRQFRRELIAVSRTPDRYFAFCQSLSAELAFQGQHLARIPSFEGFQSLGSNGFAVIGAKPFEDGDDEIAVTTKKSKAVDRKGNQAADGSKPAEPAKLCSRPGPFGDLLRSLNLSPACAS